MDKRQSYLRSHCKQKGCVDLTVGFLTHFATDDAASIFISHICSGLKTCHCII